MLLAKGITSILYLSPCLVPEEQVLTYEEVALYYPQPNRKRPIVLIGPPDVGRQELRARLLQDATRFSSAVPHTTRVAQPGEVEARDYHFVSKLQFETDIKTGQFIEYGEFQDEYYGTSSEAVRKVILAGKVCVLNLHAEVALQAPLPRCPIFYHFSIWVAYGISTLPKFNSIQTCCK